VDAEPAADQSPFAALRWGSQIIDEPVHATSPDNSCEWGGESRDPSVHRAPPLSAVREEIPQLARLGDQSETVADGRRVFDNALDQRIPLLARRALPLPLGRLPAAFGADVDGFGFRHEGGFYSYGLARGPC